MIKEDKGLKRICQALSFLLVFLLVFLMVSAIFTPAAKAAGATQKQLDAAIAWARERIGGTQHHSAGWDVGWGGKCLGFVETAFVSGAGYGPQYGSGYGTATAAGNAWIIAKDSSPPKGALVFWGTNDPAGHVALSLGGGQVIHVRNDGKSPPNYYILAESISTINGFPGSSYRGWGYYLGQPYENAAPLPDGSLESIANIYVSGLSETNATLNYTFHKKQYAWSSGAYLGTSPDNMKRVEETVDAAYSYAWYECKKWFHPLQPGTLYYYKLFVNYGNRNYVSKLYQFTTPGNPPPKITTETVEEEQSLAFTTEHRANPDMLVSQPQKLVQAGQDGVILIRHQITYEDGVEVSRKKLDETIKKAMVPQVFEYGTRIGIKGDATDDGRVDTADLLEIIEYLVNQTKCTSMDLADANDSGGVELADLIWVVEQLVK